MAKHISPVEGFKSRPKNKSYRVFEKLTALEKKACGGDVSSQDELFAAAKEYSSITDEEKTSAQLLGSMYLACCYISGWGVKKDLDVAEEILLLEILDIKKSFKSGLTEMVKKYHARLEKEGIFEENEEHELLQREKLRLLPSKPTLKEELSSEPKSQEELTESFSNSNKQTLNCDIRTLIKHFLCCTQPTEGISDLPKDDVSLHIQEYQRKY